MSEQYARVPTQLLSLVDASALQLYVALCRYADRKGACWPSNQRLTADTGQSLRRVNLSLQQLTAAGAVRRTGRGTGRRITVTYECAPDSTFTAGESAPTCVKNAHPRAHRTRPTELRTDTLTPLRVSQSEDEPMSDDQLSFLPEPERTEAEPAGTTLCMRAFFDAYGKDPISRSMISRLGKTFKQLCETYGDQLVSAAAAEMGTIRCANPNAAESFVLRLRARQTPAPDTGWSLLARDTFDKWRDEAQSV